MPAAKKHPSTRARRNVASSAATLPATAQRKGPAPALPPGTEWHPAVTWWWADLWAAPMSDEYHASDIHQLYLLATLYHDFYLSPPGTVRRTQLASEIRLQRMAFGLTPMDRRKLEWTIEQVAEAQDRTARRRATKAPAPADDPRSALRVV